MILKIEPSIKRYLSNYIKYRREKYLIQCEIKKLEMTEMLISKDTYMKFYNRLNFYNMHFKINDYIVCKTIRDRMSILKDNTLSNKKIYELLDQHLDMINLKDGTFTIDDDVNKLDYTLKKKDGVNITNKYIIYLLTNDVRYV